MTVYFSAHVRVLGFRYELITTWKFMFTLDVRETRSVTVDYVKTPRYILIYFTLYFMTFLPSRTEPASIPLRLCRIDIVAKSGL